MASIDTLDTVQVRQPDGTILNVVVNARIQPTIEILSEPSKCFSTDVGSIIVNDIKHIGSHLSSDSNESMDQCLNKYVLSRVSISENPCQMFLRNPHRGNEAIGDNVLIQAKNVIDRYNIHYYTHSAYLINLSKPTTKRNPNSDSWIIGLLTKDLQNTSNIGGKGVVVHVGKSLQMKVSEAIDKMEFYIRKVLSFATEDCPLLLETGAGQGTEICVQIEDLAEFYSRFSQEEHKKFKICVDTCHVFSAGYYPIDFLTRWEQLHSNSIGLVHFNDSEREKGARIDRHSYYLNGGYIGYDNLMKVSKWCLEHGIDMVTE